MTDQIETGLQKLHAELLELWEAANTHCVIVHGEYIPNGYEGEDTPPPPADDMEIVTQVTEYLRSIL